MSARPESYCTVCIENHRWTGESRVMESRIVESRGMESRIADGAVGGGEK